MLPRNLTSLQAKLLLGHALVIAVGMGVLLLGVNLAAPDFFERHMVGMHGPSFGPGPMHPGGPPPDVANQITAAFRQSLTEALLLAGLAALSTAVIVSVLLSRRVASPIQRLAAASRRVSAGHYTERVTVPGRDEVGQLAASFNEMAATLEGAERRRLELIGDVAHELRTPIATVEGYLEGLLDGVVEPSQRTFGKLLDEAGRLRRLADDLQELSRAEARQIPLDVRPVAPERAVRTAIERLSDDFAEKGVELRTHVPTDLPYVNADADRVVQVLTNLLTNALRYTPAPGRVDLEVTRAGAAIRFTVRDSGIGLAPDELALVFERFYRVDKSRSRALGGAGVGLTIARALVEAMGGRIWAESKGPEEGSAFAFDLPLAR
jgi:signal transduction histidine kinase